MMKQLLLACLLAIPAAAQSTATPAPPPPSDGVASPATNALLEIDVVAGKTVVRKTTLYANGLADRRDFDQDGKLIAVVGQAFLPSGTRTEVEDELAAAKFAVTHHTITCMAMGVTHTEYRINGKLVFTEEVCGADSLDEASWKALAHAEQVLDNATAPATHNPPCCKR
jgi:hypothetical protein